MNHNNSYANMRPKSIPSKPYSLIHLRADSVNFLLFTSLETVSRKPLSLLPPEYSFKTFYFESLNPRKCDYRPPIESNNNVLLFDSLIIDLHSL